MLQNRTIWLTALGIALAGMALTAMEYLLARQTGSQTVGYITMVGAMAIPLIGYWLGLRAYRRRQGEAVTLVEGIRAGLAMALLASVLLGLFYGLYFAATDAGKMAKTILRSDLEARGSAPAEIETQVQWYQALLTPWAQAGIAFASSFAFGMLAVTLYSYLQGRRRMQT